MRPIPPRVLYVVFALLAALSLVPVWAGRLLPLLDAPTHLGAVSIWHHLPDPAYGLERWFVKNTPLTPYSLHYSFVHYAGYLVGLEAASKLFVSLYLVAFPLGALVLLRASGRDPALALFAFPLAWNLNLLMGFYSNLLGNLLLLPALALLGRFLDEPTRGRGAALAALGLLVYLAHPLPWIALGTCGLALVAARGRAAWKRGLLAYTALAPSAVFAALQTWVLRPEGVSAVMGGKVSARWKSVGDATRLLPGYVMNWWPGQADEALAGVLLGVALALLATDRGADRPRARHDLWPCALVCFALYYALPVELFRPAYWWLIGGRLVPFVILFLALAARRPLLGPRRLLLVPVLAIAVALPVVQTTKTLRFNARAAPLARVAERVPMGAPVLTLVMSPREDPDFIQPLYRAFHSYVLVWRGGVSPYEFPIGFPFRYKTVPAAPPWYAPEQYTYEQHGRHWPYVLTWHDTRNRVGASPFMQLVAEDEGFRLYRNTTFSWP